MQGEIVPEKQRRAQSDDGYQNRIRVLRKKFGLKQDALAAAACVDRAYLSRIERGERPGSIGALNRIADALGVPLSELFANGGGESLFSAMFAEISPAQREQAMAMLHAFVQAVKKQPR